MKTLQTRANFLKSGLAVAAVSAVGVLLAARKRRVSLSNEQVASFEPAYLKLHRSGELARRGRSLWDIMNSCSLCPRQCGAKRVTGEEGFFRASSTLEIASYHPHFGEERLLVGQNGSGTIFFTNCGLRCVFCINWEISQGGEGRVYSIDDLAGMMLALQRRGCHNINVVTPTHYSAHILLALDRAAEQGLRLPLIYNTCGWECLEILKMLDGVVDVYLPDFKYADGKMAVKYSSAAESYPDISRRITRREYREVVDFASKCGLTNLDIQG